MAIITSPHHQRPHDEPCDESSSSSSLCARSCRWMYALFTTYPTETAQVRLLLEIALQAFQAHKMSSLVTSVWLNRLMAIVLVLNCWFTPLIFVTVRWCSNYTKRVVRLTMDTLLDVVYTVGIPTAILLPYARDVDPDSGLFPLHFYVMDAWTSVTASELRQVFVSSWIDYVSKVFPWLCVCYRLHALRSLLVSSTRPPPRFVTASTSSVSFALNMALGICGAAALVVHLQTAYLANTSSTRGCLVEMRPWFASSHVCTVVEISCSQRQIVGTQTEISEAFAEFATDRVQGLVVSHCRQFEMPPEIQTFSQIALFKFYNSTVSHWGIDAAITTATNPNVQQFFAIYTNFSTFPEGLLSPEMPQTLRDVKFIATDLTHFPESLAYAWRSVKYFAVELSVGMLDFPVVLAALPSLLYVCLSSNDLVSLSDQRLQQLSVNALQLGSNPITTIPESFGRPDTIALLSIKHTNISSLPATWLATKDDASLGSVLVIADATPLCAQLEASQVDAATPARSFPIGRFLVLCVDQANYFPNVSYPLELENLWREPNRC